MRASWGIALTVAILGVLATLTPAEALGGWATVNFEDPMPSLRAEEPVRLGLIVKQHGKTPIHVLNAEQGGHRIEIEPLLTAKHAGSSAVVRATAVRDDRIVGRFTVELTFPVAGAWQVFGAPRPFGELYIGPIQVAPALSAADEGGTIAAQSAIAPSTGDAGLAPAPNARPAVDARGRVIAAVTIAGIAVAALTAGYQWRNRGRRGRVSW